MSAETKFTSGPWVVVAGANPKNRAIVAANAAGQPVIARTVSDGFAPGCEPDFANADLIASAPDLYAAADELVRATAQVVRFINGLGKPCPASIALGAERARRALAKARGES